MERHFLVVAVRRKRVSVRAGPTGLLLGGIESCALRSIKLGCLLRFEFLVELLVSSLIVIFLGLVHR